MTIASALFLLLAATALQSMSPVVNLGWLSSLPLLASVVVYFALYRTPALTLAVALMAGLFQDSLSLMPIGYSSFCFAAAAVIIQRHRDVMVTQSPFTHLVVTAAVHTAATLFLAVLLLKDGMIPWRPGWLLLKLPAAALQGAIAGPLVVAAARALEEKLGLIEGSRDTYGAKHTFYGIG